jgi:hypothetical protein
LTVPPGVAGDQNKVRRWALETLRDRALLRCLGESSGRISEVLSPRASDFPPAAFEGGAPASGGGAVWRVRVEGKGGHAHNLRFLASLPHVKAYLEVRGDVPDRAPLKVLS